MFKVAVAATASAKCAYSTDGHGFEMYIYGETDCGTGHHWEPGYYGAGDSVSCDCFNVALTSDDEVKSFVFTSSAWHSINLYRDANCKGSLLGTSVGNWFDSSLSSASQRMSSFNVCLY